MGLVGQTPVICRLFAPSMGKRALDDGANAGFPCDGEQADAFPGPFVSTDPSGEASGSFQTPSVDDGDLRRLGFPDAGHRTLSISVFHFSKTSVESLPQTKTPQPHLQATRLCVGG